MSADRSEQEAALARMLAKVARDQAAEVAAAPKDDFSPLDAREREQIVAELIGGAKVVRLQPAKRSRRWIPVVGLAAAVVLGLIVVPRFQQLGPKNYRLEVASGAMVQRSDSAAKRDEYSSNSLFELILRPVKRAPPDVEVKTFLDGAAVQIPMERSAEGTVRLRGTIGENLNFASGEHQLSIDIGGERFDYLFIVLHSP